MKVKIGDKTTTIPDSTLTVEDRPDDTGDAFGGMLTLAHVFLASLMQYHLCV